MYGCSYFVLRRPRPNTSSPAVCPHYIRAKRLAYPHALSTIPGYPNFPSTFCERLKSRAVTDSSNRNFILAPPASSLADSDSPHRAVIPHPSRSASR